ncbi:MAG: DUF3810 family protein [Saprospiraceae bacterium]|nr:DUF3810 family protein [Saprospiraceae bacterium]
MQIIEMLRKAIGKNPNGTNQMRLFPYQSRQLWFGLLGVLAVGIKWVGAYNPQWVETYYSRGIFQAIRIVVDYSVALLPFASLYIIVPFVLFLWGRQARKWIRRKRSMRQRVTDGLIAFHGVLGGTLTLFLFLWGYNYDRVPLEVQLGIEPLPFEESELLEELEEETAAIMDLRHKVPGLSDTIEFNRSHLPADLEKHLRNNIVSWLDQHGFPTLGRVRGRFMYPAGSFLRFSTAGLYFPFSGEGHIDPGLHPIQWPYVMTHELAHGYGFGDEGTCNFLAYVASIEDEHPAVVYAGHLNYWRTLAIQYRGYNPEAYIAFRDNLPEGIQRDLDGINEAMLKYPDLVPHLQYQMYDAYLKTQGISEGMLNYNRVIMLVKAWRKVSKG